MKRAWNKRRKRDVILLKPGLNLTLRRKSKGRFSGQLVTQETKPRFPNVLQMSACSQASCLLKHASATAYLGAQVPPFGITTRGHTFIPFRICDSQAPPIKRGPKIIWMSERKKHKGQRGIQCCITT